MGDRYVVICVLRLLVFGEFVWLCIVFFIILVISVFFDLK